MNGFHEVLTSELHDDGLWHARYPTAKRTLCSRETLQARPNRFTPPTCSGCASVSRVFDRIDGSMPAGWRNAA